MSKAENAQSPVESDEKMQAFGAELYERLWGVPFGSLAKGEFELAYFSALVESGFIQLDKLTDFQLGQILKCTPTKAGNLRFSYEIRLLGGLDEAKRKETLARHVVIVGPRDAGAQKGEQLEIVLNVENRFWRNVLIDELKKVDVWSDTSFNRERVVLSAKKFVEASPKVFGIPSEQLQELVDETKNGDQKRAFLLRLLKKAAEGAASGVGQVTISALAAGMGLPT